LQYHISIPHKGSHDPHTSWYVYDVSKYYSKLRPQTNLTETSQVEISSSSHTSPSDLRRTHHFPTTYTLRTVILIIHAKQKVHQGPHCNTGTKNK